MKKTFWIEKEKQTKCLQKQNEVIKKFESAFVFLFQRDSVGYDIVICHNERIKFRHRMKAEKFRWKQIKLLKAAADRQELQESFEDLSLDEKGTLKYQSNGPFRH